MATTSFVSGVAWVMDTVIFAGGEGGELSNWSGVTPTPVGVSGAASISMGLEM